MHFHTNVSCCCTLLELHMFMQKLMLRMLSCPHQFTSQVYHAWAEAYLFIIENINWFLVTIKLACYWASLVTQTVKNPPAMQRSGFHPSVGNIPWRREWLVTPEFLPWELHGQRSLAGYSQWGHKESDQTEWLMLSLVCYF